MAGFLKKRLLLPLAALALLSASLPAYADIKIGAYGPLSGSVASISEFTKPGLTLAIDEINAKGGIRGEKLQLELLDDQCDPKQAVAAANKLVTLKVVAVISLSCSGATLAASDVLEQEGIPHLLSIASNPDITKRGLKTLFRPGLRDDTEAPHEAALIAKQIKPGQKVGVVHDNQTWGKGMADLVAAELKRLGVNDVVVYELSAKENDFSALTSRMKLQDDIKALYVALYMREAGLLIRQMDTQQFKPVLVGSTMFMMPDFAEIVGATANGATYALPRVDIAAYDDVAKALKQQNATVNLYTYQTYATMQILLQTIERHSAQPQDIITGLHEDQFKTVLGPIRFKPDGDVTEVRLDTFVYQDGKSILTGAKGTHAKNATVRTP